MIVSHKDGYFPTIMERQKTLLESFEVSQVAEVDSSLNEIEMGDTSAHGGSDS